MLFRSVSQSRYPLHIFTVPDTAEIYTGDFSLPATASGYPLNRCIVDFRILCTDAAYPFKIQTVAIIEKEYT